MKRPDKHKVGMQTAALYATRSKDPSSHVGAAIIDPTTMAVLSVGYNGFPMGVKDSEARYANREIRLAFTSHAEANAIYLAARNGTRLNGATIYVTATPCTGCAKAIIQAGIREVWLPDPCPFGESPVAGDAESKAATFAMFSESGVNVRYMPVGTVDADLFVRGRTVRI